MVSQGAGNQDFYVNSPNFFKFLSDDNQINQKEKTNKQKQSFGGV